MTMARLIASLAIVGACSEQGGARDDAGSPDRDAAASSDAGADADAPREGCTEPDRACPERHPHPAGPCEGALVCEYEEDPFFDSTSIPAELAVEVAGIGST